VSESIGAPTPIRSSGSFFPPSSPGPITYVDSPFSSRSVSIIGLLLSFSPIHAHSPLILARSLFSHLRAACTGPVARSALAHSAQQSRCTHAEAQAALSFHPPSTPSSLSLIRLYSHSRPPSPCSLARLGALRVEVEQIYLLLYLFGPKAHCRTAAADSASVPLAALVSSASASPSGSISDLADRLSFHDSQLLMGSIGPADPIRILTLSVTETITVHIRTESSSRIPPP